MLMNHTYTSFFFVHDHVNTNTAVAGMDFNAVVGAVGEIFSSTTL
jgi:hypothetical protein